jgi:ATP-dependent Lhr-like helicase
VAESEVQLTAGGDDPLLKLTPEVASWFRKNFAAPTGAQARAWPAALAMRDVLVAAPTGSGKTLSAFLSAIDTLIREGLSPAGLPDETRVVYVSPLRALSNDIEKNLIAPLAGIRGELRDHGLPEVEVRTAVRTGDTPSKDRAKTQGRPPHLFVTTPESLYILLTSEGGRRMLANVRTVIVDEIHALVGDKRGSHLALSLERLDRLTGRRVQRIGLSATQKPIEDVARFLVGAGRVDPSGTPDCEIIDTGHVRARDLAIELPGSPLETVMSAEVWEEIYERITELVRQHRTTLVFVNTRRLCERLAKNLSDRLGEDRVTSHHGSLSREHRLSAEQRLKSGALSALVATASLELGIDVGDVDLVIQVGSTRSIAAFLQRVGRSGHQLGGLPKGRIFPLSRDELVEAAALFDAVRREELDRIRMPEAPLDILAQQIVAWAAAEEDAGEDELFEWAKKAWPYRDLTRKSFDDVVRMLAQGFAGARGRRGAHVHYDGVARRIRPRRGARLAAITSGGAIPDLADYEVVLEPEGSRVGTLNEDFAIESMAGDVFQLGNASYVIQRVEPGRVRVADAKGAPPTIPFWLGEAPARTQELSAAVSRLRSDISRDLAGESSADKACARLVERLGIDEAAARQLADYFYMVETTLGAMPTQDTLVIERFFDETGGMHLVLHAPFGSRVNRALGLSLRKSFCRKFDFELQAAATEDAVVLSLGPTHSFAVDEVWGYLKSRTVRNVLEQALLDAPMFGTRFRWNAQRALAVLRFRGGKKVLPRFQRMDADDLLTVCFPEQVACLENIVGDREIPDHPLVQQTVDDCLREAMDIDGLISLLERIEHAEVKLVARDLTEPSPLASSILNARPYAFLDGAPLEERRTQAVMSRRWLDPSQAKDLAALDPAAITRVCAEAFPEPRDADELADGLGWLGFMTEAEGRAHDLSPLFAELASGRRATRVDLAGGLWVAADRLAEVLAVHPGATLAPVIAPVPPLPAADRELALREIVRSRLEAVGPITARELAASFAVSEGDVTIALGALESSGLVFRGWFRPGAAGGEVEFCERRLLARIHRATLDRLRAEIEPVTQQDFVRFLLAFQRVEQRDRLSGPSGLESVLRVLEGFEAPAAAWETDLLPARLEAYDPSFLDGLCHAGRIAWFRRRPSASGVGPVRNSPITFVSRGELGRFLNRAAADPNAGAPSHAAEAVRKVLATRGASFFDDLVRGSGRSKDEVESALGELVSRGLVSSDGFSGLRALLIPASRRRPVAEGRRHGRAPLYGMESAGRWTLLPEAASAPPLGEEDLEYIARNLLRRWGVVFRRVIDLEEGLPPFRDLLRAYRRLEARGEIRGGRFVAGFTGEQYALPEAVTLLRDVRKRPKDGTLVALSAADPLNVLGVLTPGRRVAALAGNRVLFRDGVPVAIREGQSTELIDTTADDETEGALRHALAGRVVSPRVRAYLGNSA